MKNYEWTQIETGGTTICATGTPYAFFVRRTESKHLLIYFQPGGGKVDGVPYDPDNPAFDPSVYIPEKQFTARDEHWDKDNPEQMGGIFNLTDERNPFSDYNMVFISYCTGDMHWGNNVHSDLHHKGYVNATTVLNWTYKQFPDMERVFISGSSAGAAGASFHAAAIATHYPHAKLNMLTDSLGGVRASLHDSLESWGAFGVVLNTLGYDDLSAEALNLNTPYIVTGKRFPDMTIAQFNATRDFAQVKIAEHLGDGTPLAELLKLNHADIRAEIDNFYTYTADDDIHVILRKDKFFGMKTNGVRLHEWVTALANDQQIEDVMP